MLQWLANFLTNNVLQLLGITTVPGAILAAVLAIAFWVLLWHRGRLKEGKLGLQAWHFLFVGIAGTAIMMLVALGAAGIMVLRGQGIAAVGHLSRSAEDDGPLKWFYNLQLHGGPLSKANVFSLKFYGTNASQREIRLVAATIRSALKGSEIPLEVVAEGQLAGVDAINLIPPGAPIELVAKFDPPDGLPVQDFLSTWARFSLVVKDDTREYRLPFNEGNIQAFFPGMIGPHVTKKTSGAN